MKERPILFSAPMVRAILAGTKTQTRRVLKPEGALEVFQFRGTTAAAGADEPTGEWGWCGHPRVVNKHIRCPYGQPGDRLWLRETWAWSGDTAVPEAWRVHDGEVWFRADPARSSPAIRWRPSIHMPRWASRITLEVTSVRVERLQSIGESDAIAEGSREPTLVPITGARMTERGVYAALWESINGRGSWEDNPWVWAISFRRVAPSAPTQERHETESLHAR